MKLATRLKVILAVMVIASVGAYAMYLNPKAFMFTRDGEDDNIVLSATWEPNNSTHNTNIKVTVDGAILMVRSPRLSPWGETAVVAKGAKIKMTASRYSANLRMLDCMIMRNGSVPGGGHMKIESSGVVECNA